MLVKAQQQLVSKQWFLTPTIAYIPALGIIIYLL